MPPTFQYTVVANWHSPVRVTRLQVYLCGLNFIGVCRLRLTFADLCLGVSLCLCSRVTASGLCVSCMVWGLVFLRSHLAHPILCCRARGVVSQLLPLPVYGIALIHTRVARCGCGVDYMSACRNCRSSLVLFFRNIGFKPAK